MTQVVRVRWTVCLVVWVILIGGGAFTASAKDDGRRIVTFQGIDLTTALGVVTASGCTVVHELWFIDALAIQLPLTNIDGALKRLLDSSYVTEVSEDPLGSVGRITPTTFPVKED